ncbi:condensation domain-containing protein [Nocardia transvalensis]|uniref:condensation domain-containing protein n=1 Tax=Nocardia transvalensis TaxID=37333 RepID=UPI0018960791|nr:condensation domain-containing protein [Nocardia transvalensis]MBF6330795.1 short-chain dehydrogenase [Nocardia transvalensis]
MDTEIRRPLSASERWYWICDQLSALNVVARVHLRGALSETALRTAADALAREHPLLRVSIARQPDGTDPVFVAPADPQVPIRTVDGDRTDWEREVDEVELATPLEWATRPLARITDVRCGSGGAESHDLVFTVSHIIADGTTALALLRRLVELAATGTAPDSIRSRPALPAPEALLPRAFRAPWGVATAAGAGLVDQAVTLVARPRRLRPQIPLEPTARRSRLLHRELSGDRLEALVARCRAEGVTVHGALTAAMAQAYGTVVEPGVRGRIGIGSPIDFRGEVSVSPEDAGAYVATVPSYLRFGPGTDLWDVARRLNRELTRRKRFRQHLSQIAMLPVLCPASVTAGRRTVELLDSRGPGNICLSNIGRYDFPDRIGDWTLSGAQFIAGISVSGYFVGSVNTSHDVLHWNFTYIEDVVSTERATRWADETLNVLTAEPALPVPVPSGE